MALDPASLPDDVDALKRLIVGMAREAVHASTLIEKLRGELARLKRARFGTSSEKLGARVEQLELAIEALEVDEAERLAATPAIAEAVEAARIRPARRPLPEHLPRESVIHPGPCACPACGGTLRRIGEDVTESLDYVPGRFPVLAPGTGRTKTGRLWTYVRDERPHGGARPPAAVFFASPDRRGERPLAHLAGFSGVLVADGYAGFNGLYEEMRPGGALIEAACWAHVRRKFFDVHAATGSTLAAEALKTWAEASLAQVPGRSDLAKALRYMLARWPALTRAFDDGRIGLDNNPAERALRGVAVGRKNYLFAGSDRGAERAAAFYTLIESAKLNGLDSEAYLRDVLTRIADHPAKRLADLLPWNWTPTLSIAHAA